MATQDISRDAFDSRKRYAGVRMQQGRVLLDDDWNENERIAGEDLRRSRVDIIGPAGSLDQGFQVSNPQITADGVDFDLNAGSFYLGGLRLELDQPQTYRLQTDVLQSSALAGDAPGGERNDLVVLMTYQQPVSAVEDSELFEAALGGPDTTTRLRTMQRVLLIPGLAGDTCESAWAEALQLIGATLNAENELVHDATITVDFAQVGTPDDLCTPTAAGGYLGAENQAIRVQFLGNNEFTWGFDNAAPLYRVQVTGDRSTLSMLTQPKDQAHWPLSGQVVEILPWAAVLPNHEKTAEAHGHLTRVVDSYDPDQNTLTLDSPIPVTGFDDWTGRADQGQLAEGGVYYFMRVWNRGADDTSPAAIPFTPGTAVPLGNTGLEVTFSGTQFRLADYGIIAARPETPHRVVPWQLETGRAPHGRRIFATPLALIHWPADQNTAPVVDDCRPRFRPLTEQEVCCTYVVGDGQTTHGDFDSIEEAVQHLPQGGGKICLLPGTHQANVLIANRKNITISGCDKATRVIPRLDSNNHTLFTVVDSQCVTLEHMDLVTVEGTAIAALGTRPGALAELAVTHNRILALTNAVHVLQGQTIQIEHNIIRMLDKEEGDVAIFVLADDVRIERNDIGVIPAGTTPPEPDDGDEEEPPDPSDPCAEPDEFYINVLFFTLYLEYIWSNFLVAFLPIDPYKTLGGIQVGSGSERVLVLDNQVNGGAGNGITLGSDLEAGDLPPGEEEEPPGRDTSQLTIDENFVWGGVSDGKQPLQDISVGFRNQDRVYPAVTAKDGTYLADIEPGTYEVFLADPRYEVRSVEFQEREELGRFARINVVAAEPRIDLRDVLAFIYDVTIAENRIVNMGESGIGVPFARPVSPRGFVPRDDLVAAAPIATGKSYTSANASVTPLLGELVSDLGLLTGFVVNLQIEDNVISGCLTNIFDLEGEETARQNRGVGGISLGLCERLIIRHNRIYDNGRNYRGPAHGIYVFYASEADFVDNRIVGNSPQANSRFQVGDTGGLRVVFGTMIGSVVADPGQEKERDTGIIFPRQALRVQGNFIEHPLGRAMTLWAIGPVQVTDNVLATHLARNLAEVIGGRGISLAGQSPLLTLLAGGLNAGVVVVLNLGLAAFLQLLMGDREQRELVMPTGQVMFNDNQTRLADADEALVSLALFSLDDISFNDNQVDVLAGTNLVVNALVFAPTVRAGNNRLQEYFL